MRLSDFFKNLTDEAFDRTDDGDLVVRIDSEMLPGVNVDTYQCFNGDGWTDMELDHFATEGVPGWMVDHPAAQRADVELHWDDFDWSYDHRATLRDLSEAAAQDLIDSGGITFPQIITGYDIWSTYSPTAYNFATDSFDAEWHVDTDELVEALADMDTEDLEDWARDRWASRSGFISSIPRYFNTEHDWAVVWAAIARVLVEDEYDGFMAVAEVEHEAYSEHTEFTLNSRGAEKIWEAVTGTEVPVDADLHDGESLAALLHQRLPVQDEELPITA